MRACTFAAAVAGLLLVSAAPPEDAIRAGNAACERGDLDAAAALYAAAEGRAADPGLVAYNRAAVHFARGDFREAELDYGRALDDPACPAERRAKALYNRGTCLIRRGTDAAAYRAAIADLTRCRDASPADAGLRADVRHNLELAKLLWAEARKKSAKPSKASASGPEDEPPPPAAPPRPEADPKAPNDGTGAKPEGPDGADRRTQPVPAPAATATSPAAAAAEARTPGPGTLPPLLDRDQPQALSPEDAREYLRRTAERLQRDRRALRQALSPDRPGLKDW